MLPNEIDMHVGGDIEVTGNIDIRLKNQPKYNEAIKSPNNNNPFKNSLIKDEKNHELIQN